MKNLFDVMRTKEQDVIRVKKEVEALRIAARLLAEDSDNQVLQMPEAGPKRAVAEQPSA